MIASANDLLAFIEASPSPYHCVAECVRRLQAAGFRELDEGQDFGELLPGDRVLIRRGGSLVAFLVGEQAPAEAGFRIVGAHTDSPNLRLKPRPDYTREGFAQWGVEVYGGVLLHTWLDRDLGVAGRVSRKGPGGVATELVRLDRAVARIPNLAIHLNREVNAEGFKVNEQKHLPPVLGLAGAAEQPGALERVLAEAAGCAWADVLGWDLSLYDLQAPALGGLDDEFIFAARLDNQASCYNAVQALVSLEGPGPATAAIALYDHEECGSLSAVGADSSFLEMLMHRLVEAHPSKVRGGISRAACSSLLVSADMAHGVHPNYADRHDEQHKPMLNGGPVLKSNANNRYATTGVTGAWFTAACRAEGIEPQHFITRSDLRCGTTIGPMVSARLGIPTVDVGCAMLSMHSIREQAGARDVEPFTRVLSRMLAGE